MFKPMFSAVLVAASLTACTTPATHTADNVFITDTHAAPVAFQSLRVEGQTVKGQIRLTGRNPVRFGHVDYAVLDASGKVREEGWAEHSSAIRLRNTHRPALFTIDLRQPLARGEQVRLTYHTGSHSR